MKKAIIIILIFLFSAFNGYSQMIWSTYLGGRDADFFAGFKIDSVGNAFVSGCTKSSNYPTTLGAYNNSFASEDLFVSKLNSSGTYLIFSTFIGPVYSISNPNSGSGLIIDNHGNSYITGSGMQTYPTTPNVYDTSFYSGNIDTAMVFVTKLNSSGSDLIYSSFIGKGNSCVNSIAIDTEFNTFITGGTASYDFPTTSGAYDNSYNLGGDIFITKLKSNADSLIYSTYIGGGMTENVNDIKIDDFGNTYLSGWTFSSDYPTTTNAISKSIKGTLDIIITKLNQLGDSLIYSTYIGGSHGGWDAEYGYSITIDREKNICFTGLTLSNDYPTTTGAYDISYNNYMDIIITKLDSLGDSLIFSTYLGGSLNDRSNSIILDNKNNLFIIGYSSSANFPITNDAFSRIKRLDDDVIITVLNDNCSSIIYSTFLGSNDMDHGFSLALDSLNNIYATGITKSNTFPITKGAYDTIFGGILDIFLTKLKISKGSPIIQAFDFLIFPILLCNTHFQDTTIIFYNTGNNVLGLFREDIIGLDSSEFSIIIPNIFPLYIQPNDSIKFVIRFTPNDVTGEKEANLVLENNSTINPYIINLTARNDNISFNVNNEDSDTIVIDLGTFCPGDTIKDTTITIFNKSSIGTTFKIENVDPGLEILGTNNVEKKEAVPLKKRKK
jgi:hypothetical protein